MLVVEDNDAVRHIVVAMLEDKSQSADFLKTMENWKEVKHAGVVATVDVVDLGGGSTEVSA